MTHRIIPSEESFVKGTEELNRQVSQEMLLPDEKKHTIAQIFEEGEDLDRRRHTKEDNQDSKGSSS